MSAFGLRALRRLATRSQTLGKQICTLHGMSGVCRFIFASAPVASSLWQSPAKAWMGPTCGNQLFVTQMSQLLMQRAKSVDTAYIKSPARALPSSMPHRCYVCWTCRGVDVTVTVTLGSDPGICVTLRLFLISVKLWYKVAITGPQITEPVYLYKGSGPDSRDMRVHIN